MHVSAMAMMRTMMRWGLWLAEVDVLGSAGDGMAPDTYVALWRAPLDSEPPAIVLERSIGRN
jgi:hypothetical protein